MQEHARADANTCAGGRFGIICIAVGTIIAYQAASAASGALLPFARSPDVQFWLMCGVLVLLGATILGIPVGSGKGCLFACQGVKCSASVKCSAFVWTWDEDSCIWALVGVGLTRLASRMWQSLQQAGAMQDLPVSCTQVIHRDSAGSEVVGCNQQPPSSKSCHQHKSESRHLHVAAVTSLTRTSTANPPLHAC